MSEEKLIEILGCSFTVDELWCAVGVCFFIMGFGLLFVSLIEAAASLITSLCQKINDHLLNVHRDDKQSFYGSIPLRDCPCCGSAPSVIKKYRKFDYGRVYCRGCGIGTDNAHLTVAFMNWNRRPHVIDLLSKNDYNQIIQLDKQRL